MKIFCFLVVVMLGSFKAQAKDSRACYLLANIVSMNQDRFDQAEIAYMDINAICNGDARPQACAEQVKADYADAKAALEKTLLDYKSAGCED